MDEQDNKKASDSGEPVTKQPSSNTEHNKAKRKNDKQDDNDDSKIKWYVTISVSLGVIIILLLLILLIQCSSEPKVLNPDFPPKETEKNLIPLPDDGEGKLDAEKGGGAVVLDYKDRVNIDLSDGVATLDFANPGKSTQNMMMQIVIQDVVIAESGLIPSGYHFQKLDIFEDAKKMLKEGEYKGKFVIYYYNPETNERAMVNSEGAVTVTVYP